MAQDRSQLINSIESKIKTLEERKRDVRTVDLQSGFEIAISNLYIALVKFNN